MVIGQAPSQLQNLLLENSKHPRTLPSGTMEFLYAHFKKSADWGEDWRAVNYGIVWGTIARAKFYIF